MGTKITATTITGSYASVDALNANFAALADEFDSVVYRDGTSPNTLTATLDVNSQRLINLANATTNQEPVTLLQLNNAILSADPAVQLPLNLLGLCYADTTGTITNDSYLRWDATDDGVLILGGGATATPIRLLEPSGSGSNYIEFKAQAMAASLSFTLPAADGTSGQALKTDGAGTLSWGTFSTVTDHGALTGLSDDDHTQYILAAGTRPFSLGSDATGDIWYRTAGGVFGRLAIGAEGEVLTVASGLPSWAAAAGGGGGFTDTGVTATTSGTAHDFTVTGAKVIIVNLQGVICSGFTTIGIQLGDSGGIETTGYSGNSTILTNAAAVVVASPASTLWTCHTNNDKGASGSIIITLLDSATNLWMVQSQLISSTTSINLFVGYKTLSAAITTVRLTTEAGHTFAGGSANVLWA